MTGYELFISKCDNGTQISNDGKTLWNDTNGIDIHHAATICIDGFLIAHQTLSEPKVENELRDFVLH